LRSTQLVSVVIPAYNAAATLDATQRSVRAQQHDHLEIIVVDDGSTDETFAIASEHAAADPRVQVLQQENAGLAAARNAGWRCARADLISFLDADDLWAPSKIERQVDAFLRGGSKVGLIYCGSARIDGEGVVTSLVPLACFEGDVFRQLCTGNFIGNGSTAMVTRQALIHADGFDTALRAAGGQGCEDYLMQCRIAEKFHFAVVKERLVGYRYLPHNMSSLRPGMLRSWMLVVEKMSARHPAHVFALRRGMRNYATWIIFDAISRRAFAQLPELVRLVLRFPAPTALAIPFIDMPREAMKRVRIRAARLLRGRSGSLMTPDNTLSLAEREPEKFR
jgi:glycosyltransferase involved in cell wall biosynthesis